MDSEEESRSGMSDFGDVMSLEIHDPDSEKELVACESCGECFSSEVNLAKHFCNATTNNPSEFTCQSCSLICPSRDALVVHVLNAHAQPRSYACTICAMPFSSQVRLSKHTLLHYSSQRFVCSACSEVLPDQSSLAIHVTTQCRMQQFVCPICSKMFVSHGNLKKHILVHTGTQRFECTVCTKVLTNRGNLTKHMMIHTGVRPFKCDVCGRAFTLRRNLKEHLLIHQGIRPYSCTTCGKTFTQLSNLNQHLLIHAGIQDYPCELCGKCFTLRGNLKKHILIHAQEYAFSCQFCGKAFTLSGNLKKHLASKGTKCYKMNGRPDDENTGEYSAGSYKMENSVESCAEDPLETGNDSSQLFSSVYSEVTVQTADNRPNDGSVISEEECLDDSEDSSENASSDINRSDVSEHLPSNEIQLASSENYETSTNLNNNLRLDVKHELIDGTTA